LILLIIETPSRLHVTLIDLNGKYGRIDGGVGITTHNPRLILEAYPGYDDLQIEFTSMGSDELPKDIIGDYRDKIFSATHKINQYLNREEGYHFKLREIFPSHSGLGSGTQLSLAVAKLILRMNDQDLPTPQIAEIVGRGGTSGIGVASFDHGGFLVDGGHKKVIKKDFLPSSASKASPPPILARYDFPEDWKIILAIPQVKRKVFGSGEVDIFQKYCPIPVGEVQELIHLLIMKMMPAVIEEDLDGFGGAVNLVQNVGFKKIELSLQNPFIKDLMDVLKAAGAAGVGMSSFGPTVYAVTDTNSKDILRAARNSMKNKSGDIILTNAQNEGASIY
jgi:beta-ribofuranosylaminobenzene 5'-phosphate synthase